MLGITRSNITFVGTGTGTTTIIGGFGIYEQENITFKNMTVTNTSQYGSGIYMLNAKVELMDVVLKGCTQNALFISYSATASTVVATRCEFANSSIGAIVQSSLTSATFNNCVFHDNKYDGIFGDDNATIHLHGEATAIHSNSQRGIIAHGSAKVIIHLPSNHNTTYNNTREDRNTDFGGTITNVDD